MRIYVREQGKTKYYCIRYLDKVHNDENEIELEDISARIMPKGLYSDREDIPHYDENNSDNQFLKYNPVISID